MAGFGVAVALYVNVKYIVGFSAKNENISSCFAILTMFAYV